METKWVGLKTGHVVHEVRAETVRPWERDPHDRIATHAGREGEVVFAPEELFDTYEAACKYAGVRYRMWTHWDFHLLKPGDVMPVPTDRRHAAYEAAKKYRQRCLKRKEEWNFSLTQRTDGSWVIMRTA